MRSWITASVLTLAVVVSFGCAGLSKVEMSAADRAQTKTIKVRADDRLPEDMYFHGRAQSLSMGLGGALGGIAGMAMAGDPKTQIAATMKGNNINLPTILQSEFAKALQSQRDFQAVDEKSPADAEMVLIVNLYGLGQSDGFSGLYPMINVSASLRRPDGTVIWQRTDYVTPRNKENSEQHEFGEFIERPELLRERWSHVSGIVSRMLVRELSPER